VYKLFKGCPDHVMGGGVCAVGDYDGSEMKEMNDDDGRNE
jgi:hypothetical protein